MFQRRGIKPRETVSGFTLIEVGIVLLVMAIIAAAVVPQVINYMKRYRLGVAARNVATAVQRARYLAVSNNTRAGILIKDWQRIEIEQYDVEGNAPAQNKGVVLLPEGMIISSDAPRQIAFDGRGVITPLPVRSPAIRIDGTSGYYAVVSVSPTGQVTVSETRRKESD
jgi:prepilin-type N-terminal cleavage/methylation domain-containing protein